MIIDKSPVDDYFSAKGVSRRWEHESGRRTPKLKRCVSARDIGLAVTVRRVRRFAVWAIMLKLLQAEHDIPLKETTKIRDQNTRRMRRIYRMNIVSCGPYKDVYRIWVPGSGYWYAVGRMGTYDKNECYYDQHAAADNRVLAVCEAEEWRSWLWHNMPLRDYEFRPAKLRERIIDVRAFPVNGVIPGRRLLWGSSGMRILFERKVLRFDYYRRPYDDGPSIIDQREGKLIAELLLQKASK